MSAAVAAVIVMASKATEKTATRVVVATVLVVVVAVQVVVVAVQVVVATVRSPDVLLETQGAA